MPKSTAKKTLAKRISRVERQVAARKPEMKMLSFNFAATVAGNSISLIDMTQCDIGDHAYERNGDEIKVWRIEIRGFAISQLDQYVIQKHGPNNPQNGDFGTGASAFLDSGSTSLWTEWKTFRNYFVTLAGNASLREVVKFPHGIRVHYDGEAAQPFRNGLLLVTRNNTANAYYQDLSIRVWFTDA